MSEICPHALGKLEAAVAIGRKKKRKKKEEKKRKKKKEKGKNTCRTIEDGIGSAFDSNDVSYPRRC